jgi:hypothetical protein
MAAQGQKATETERSPEPEVAATITAAVARGRTVARQEHVNGSTRRFGPGTLVTLPRDEALRLIKLGYLNDPGGVEIPVGMGPVFEARQPSVIRPV